MALVRDSMCRFMVLLCVLCGGANVEQCVNGKEPGSSVCTELVDLYEKHGKRRSQVDDKGIARHLSSDSEDSSPLQTAASELADECTLPDDQASCDKAIWLAGLLEKLTEGTSAEPIAEASKVSLLATWFKNPAGPGGFFNFVDVDRSGSLSADELSAHNAGDLMQLIDIDDDGQASRKECRDFLRGCVVLFKKLPTLDADLARATIPVMLEDADTVTMASTVATGPSSNPLSVAVSELERSCPEPAERASCDKAVPAVRSH